MKVTYRALVAAAIVVPTFLLGACGGSGTGATTASSRSSASVAASSASEGGGTQASAGSGAPAGRQPDVNGDGKVVIGMMSPGDTHDNGYYESFVDSAQAFAKKEGWKVIVVDKIDPADAQTQALNLCAQGADLIAIGASELATALNAAPDPSCAKTEWYMDGGAGIKQTKYFAQSMENVQLDGITWGYAAGLAMKQKGVTKAGYITGQKASFATTVADAFRAGMQQVIPDSSLIETYTGDFDDSAKAKEAANADIANKVGFLFPYLGGATDAVANLANQNHVLTMTPGTDRCNDPKTPFSISTISNAGARFTAALQEFQKGDLQMGKTREWVVGVDSVPTIIMCGDLSSLQPQVDKFMKEVGTGKIDVASVIAAAKKK